MSIFETNSLLMFFSARFLSWAWLLFRCDLPRSGQSHPLLGFLLALLVYPFLRSCLHLIIICLAWAFAQRRSFPWLWDLCTGGPLHSPGLPSMVLPLSFATGALKSWINERGRHHFERAEAVYIRWKNVLSQDQSHLAAWKQSSFRRGFVPNRL